MRGYLEYLVPSASDICILGLII